MKVEFPVKNTFIQYPALRMGSLEGFLQERCFQSHPASRMASLEEAPPDAQKVDVLLEAAGIDYSVKHTFVDMPAMRNFSLEGFLEERGFQSCPASRTVSLEEEPAACRMPVTPSEVPTADLATTAPLFLVPRDSTIDSLENFFTGREALSSAPAFQFSSHLEPTFPCDVQLGVSPQKLSGQFQQDSGSCDVSTTEGADSSDSELHSNPPEKLTISLTESLCISSAGSADHMAGTCKPCAFLWKPEGCKHGQSCYFCHLCPMGEVKRRKKEKLACRKMVKAMQSQANGFNMLF